MGRLVVAALVVLLCVAVSFLVFADDEKRAGLPVPRSGADMIGKAFDTRGLEWLDRDGADVPALEGKVTLVRWWTDSCPFCVRSLPAIAKLEAKYGGRGFQTVGIYHAKPPRDVAAKTVLRWARERKFKGVVAVDPGWRVLKKFYLSHGRRGATSASFLLDPKGRVRFLHPGPELRPAKDEKQLQGDYDDMVKAIEFLLGELEESKRGKKGSPEQDLERGPPRQPGN